jgi:signal transduction histidine kinase
MTNTAKNSNISPFQATYWKSRYEKEKLLNTSIVSLMKKFGSSLDLAILQKELLLTLMGQYLTGDSCFYTVQNGHANIVCTISYGRPKRQNLPCLTHDSPLLAYLAEHSYPVHFDELHDDLFDDRDTSTMSKHYSVISPLRLNRNIIGLVFLGSKISSKKYSESDYALLHQLCTLAAMTFNHAILFQNAKLSIEELHKLNDTRTDIISRITHEFRTPLTVIKAGISSLKLSHEKEAVTGWINNSITRLEQLIFSLLDLNENYYDDTFTDDSEWDPVTLLHEIMPQHSEAASQKDISIQIIEIQKNGLPQLKLSTDRFRQIMNNVIDNAIKYSNESSTIIIEFEKALREPDEAKDGICLPDWKKQFKMNLAELSNVTGRTEKNQENDEIIPRPQEIIEGNIETPRRYAVIKITDGGIGIPIEDIKLLSQPFHQASNSPDIGVKGKGLGLTVTQKILSSFGGKIYCTSKEGRGTTFTFFLPIM